LIGLQPKVTMEAKMEIPAPVREPGRISIDMLTSI
jgi:hypothetical protein